MTSRSYGQSCPLAIALDRVGERWTLLVVRDLAVGPKRYSDLQRGLPGIGTTLLAERLRRLEEDGVVARRELPPPAASTVYELTPDGHALASAMLPLARWGLRYLDETNQTVRPEWLIMFWQDRLDPEMASGVRDVYEFRIDGQTFHVAIDDGQLTGGVTPAPAAPDVVVTTDWGTLLRVGAGALDPGTALADGSLAVEGDPDAMQRCYELLSDTTPAWMASA